MYIASRPMLAKGEPGNEARPMLRWSVVLLQPEEVESHVTSKACKKCLSQ